MKFLTQRQVITLSAAIALQVFAVGCEDVQKSSVKGLVTIDGEPLTHGSILFVAGSKNKADSAPGNIGKDGTYMVQIGQSGELGAGEYRVEIFARGPSTPNPEGGPPTLGEVITPEHYADVETSGLRYNVRKGENVIDIALVSDQPGLEVEGTTAESEATMDEEPVEEPVKSAEEESSAEPAVDAQPST